MSFVLRKVKSTGTVLWNHKKKTIFAISIFSYGINWLNASNRDSRIRTYYAIEAQKHGEQPIHPTQQLQRVTVLINPAANGRNVSDLFKKNALPLLNLAGVDVNMIKVEDENQMEDFGRALDRTETDCIYIVGGDGSLSRVITGMMNNNSKLDVNNTAPVPICIFPGGRRNLFLTRLIPGIFGEKDDVRRYCESAMAIVEDSRRTVSPFECSIINNSNKDETKTFYVLSSLSAGWLEHCEQKKPKLWYFGKLRSEVAYFFEFLKRFPNPLNLQVYYEDFCAGCNQCRQTVKKKPQPKQPESRSWLSMFFGTGKKNNVFAKEIMPIDYSNVVNENCGSKHELNIDAVNFEVSCVQKKDCCGLQFELDEKLPSRFSAIRVGWAREALNDTKTFSNSKTEKDNKLSEPMFSASHMIINFLHIPDFIQKLSIAGDWASFENFAEKSVSLKATNKKIEMFLPSTTKARLNACNC